MKRDCPHQGRHQHGTPVAYNSDDCRCEACRTAVVEYQRDLRARRAANGGHLLRPSLSTGLRLRALVARGWDRGRLGERLGMKPQYVSALIAAQSPRVTPDVQARVAKLYDEIWDAPAPGRLAGRTRKHAARRGWQPPLALDDDTLAAMDKMPSLGTGPSLVDNTNDLHTGISPSRQGESPALIDEIAVAEAIHGRRVHLTKAEMTEVVRKLSAMGRSAEEIGEVLGTSSRTVVRKRRAA
jgi:DNA-binding CsgD family transcriptional regulator